MTRGISEESHPANWNAWGRAAGPRRNQEMLMRKPNLVVAFPGGEGTADMVQKAIAAGVKVVHCNRNYETR
jgi:predicted Rossmann-fold nucleotide-binding protein